MNGGGGGGLAGFASEAGRVMGLGRGFQVVGLTVRPCRWVVSSISGKLALARGVGRQCGEENEGRIGVRQGEVALPGWAHLGRTASSVWTTFM